MHMMSSLDLNKSRVKYSRKVKQVIRPFRVPPEPEGEKRLSDACQRQFLTVVPAGRKAFGQASLCLRYASIDSPASLLYIPGITVSCHRSLITMDSNSHRTPTADHEAIRADQCRLPI